MTWNDQDATLTDATTEANLLTGFLRRIAQDGIELDEIKIDLTAPHPRYQPFITETRAGADPADLANSFSSVNILNVLGFYIEGITIDEFAGNVSIKLSKRY